MKGSSSAPKPKGWPKDVTFIDRPVYSSLLGKETRAALENQTVDAAIQHVVPLTKGPSSSVRITLIDIPTHPACGQCGLFAAQHLPPSTFILSYVGYVHGEADADPTSDYDLSLDRDTGTAVDATKMGNEARFINDYRGVGPPGPNAEFKDVWVTNAQGQAEKRIGVFVLSAGKAGKRSKGIAKGEEILVSYGKGFWAGRA